MESTREDSFLLSVFSGFWDFIKVCFNGIRNVIISIFNFFTSPFHTKDEDNIEVQKITTPYDEYKKRHKEARNAYIHSFFKQKNVDSAKEVKKINNSQTIFRNDRPFHYDQIDDDQQSYSDDDDDIPSRNNYNIALTTRDIKTTRNENRRSTYINNNNKNDRLSASKNHQRVYNPSQNQNSQRVDNNNDHTKNSSHRQHMPLSKEDQKRREIGRETMQVVETGKYTIYNKKTRKNEVRNIKDKIEWCICNTRTIKPNDRLTFDNSISQDSQMCQIDVTTESSFEALRRVKTSKSGRIKEACILNFASATQPGGGFLNGRNAQEETLSRQSALYSSLKSESEMYDYNKANENPYYSDYMIYSPNVPFFRDDNYKFVEYFTASVITSPAVNYSDLLKSGKDPNEIKGKVYRAMKRRCERIIKLCISNGNKAIILGAFGCGVFKNPPEMISQIFKEILIDEGYGYYLTYVVFPIFSKNGTEGNTYKIFHNVFNP